MELFKKLKSHFLGLALAGALFAPTVASASAEQLRPTSLVTGEQPAQQEPSTLEALQKVITPRFITDTGSLILTPYLMNKMGYDAQKSYGAMAAQALLTPTLSYLAWEGWTGACKGWQWTKNLFSSHKKTAPEQAQKKKEEDATRKDMRKDLIAGGIGNILTTAIIKVLAWENKPQDSWFSLSWKFGRLIIVNTITSLLVNNTYDKLLTKKKTVPPQEPTPAVKITPAPVAQPKPVAQSKPQPTTPNIFRRAWSWLFTKKETALQTPKKSVNKNAAQNYQQATSTQPAPGPANNSQRKNY